MAAKVDSQPMLWLLYGLSYPEVAYRKWTQHIVPMYVCMGGTEWLSANEQENKASVE